MGDNITDIKSDVMNNEELDDNILMKSYENSVLLTKEEVAKFIANSTNITQVEDPNNSVNVSNNENQSRDTSDDSSANDIFQPYKIGDFVRATYDDGIDYEAKIISINENEGTCMLKYIGYGNKQEANLTDLIDTWGKKARRLQCLKAQQDSNCSEPKTFYNEYNGYPGFNLSTFPPPPPAPPLLDNCLENNEQLSAMLMAWYMSGFYTGVYHGMNISKSEKDDKVKK